MLNKSCGSQKSDSIGRVGLLSFSFDLITWTWLGEVDGRVFRGGQKGRGRKGMVWSDHIRKIDTPVPPSSFPRLL